MKRFELQNPFAVANFMSTVTKEGRKSAVVFTTNCINVVLSNDK